MSYNIKKIILALLFSTFAQAANVQITQLPLGTAAGSASQDVFPYVDSANDVTKKMTVWDLVNLPPMLSTFAPIASPTFTGSVTVGARPILQLVPWVMIVP